MPPCRDTPPARLPWERAPLGAVQSTLDEATIYTSRVRSLTCTSHSFLEECKGSTDSSNLPPNTCTSHPLDSREHRIRPMKDRYQDSCKQPGTNRVGAGRVSTLRPLCSTQLTDNGTIRPKAINMLTARNWHAAALTHSRRHK